MQQRLKKLIKVTMPNGTTEYYYGLDEAANALSTSIITISRYLHNKQKIPFGIRFEEIKGPEKLLWLVNKNMYVSQDDNS